MLNIVNVEQRWDLEEARSLLNVSFRHYIIIINLYFNFLAIENILHVSSTVAGVLLSWAGFQRNNSQRNGQRSS